MTYLKKSKQAERLRRVQLAQDLYKQGFTTREIAPRVRRSHAWVALAIKENLTFPQES